MSDFRPLWGKDIHYTFFGNVVRGKSALFRLVVLNGFAHFFRKVFARRELLPGKFGFLCLCCKFLQKQPILSHNKRENSSSLISLCFLFFQKLLKFSNLAHF